MSQWYVMTCGSVKANEGPGSGTQIDKGRTNSAWKSTGSKQQAEEKVSSLGIFRNHLGRLQTVLGKGMGDGRQFT